MRLSGRLLLSATVALVAAWALLQTAGWPIKTALYPRVVGIPLLALAVAESVLCATRDEPEEGERVDVALSTGVPPQVAVRRIGEMVAWLGGFFLAIILIGFPRAIPLFVFIYLKWQSREGWVTSVLLAAAATLVFNLLFVRLLHLPFADGMFWQALFR